MKYRQLLLDFGRSVMRRVKSSPETHKQPRRKSRLRPDPLLEDFANQLLRAAGIHDLRVAVCWNPTLRTTAGLASWPEKRIVLNPKLVEVSFTEVQRTLRHELAHLLAQHKVGRRRIDAHGPEWRNACELLGIPNESRCHDLPFKRRKIERRFFYACSHCSTVLARVRSLTRPVACIKCCTKFNAGRYDSRFRFRPIQAPDAAAA